MKTEELINAIEGRCNIVSENASEILDQLNISLEQPEHYETIAKHKIYIACCLPFKIKYNDTIYLGYTTAWKDPKLAYQEALRYPHHCVLCVYTTPVKIYSKESITGMCTKYLVSPIKFFVKQIVFKYNIPFIYSFYHTPDNTFQDPMLIDKVNNRNELEFDQNNILIDFESSE